MNSNKLKFDSDYLPRKCDITNKLLTAKDYASVQIRIGGLNKRGQYNGKTKTLVLCGFLRKKGKADISINYHIFEKNKL